MMLSPLWHRVEGLKLRLKPGVEIERHVVRGQIWYVARDRLSTRAHRFSSPVYSLLMRMDGDRTLGKIWNEVVELFAADAPSQEQMIQVISQLYGLDLIHADAPVDRLELAERAHRTRQRLWLQSYMNPAFFRVPLVNPDRFLDATVHLVRPFMSYWGLALWIGMVGWFGFQVAQHWEALAHNVTDQLLTPENLVVTLLLFPIIKIVHELAHGYAAKAAGGEVHEIGLMFMVFLPAPYVDASSSALFARKRDRVLVAAAGMMAELVLAAAAMAVWINAEPGVARAMAFSVMLIASVSTIVFNANPLLRFDGYYILSDVLDIPNLSTRSNRYWIYLVQRYLFGMKQSSSPVMAAGETKWFLSYAPLALAYRLFVTASIALLLGAHYFVLGVVLAIWTVALSVVWPVLKGVKFVLMAPALAGHRLRAVSVTAFGSLALLIGFGWAPAPHGTVARGVVWIPDGARIVAESAGVVARIHHASGARVAKGDVLFELEDSFAATQRRLAEARLSEIRYRLTAAAAATPADLEFVRRRLEFATNDLAEAGRRMAALVVRSPSDGVFIVPKGDDIRQSYAAKGALLGYVMPDVRPIIRVTVPEAEIEVVRRDTRAVAVRLSSEAETVYDNIAIIRETPGASRRLPSAALAASAGGPITTMPGGDEETPEAVLPFFEIDVQLPRALEPAVWGERVYVRFDHGSAPLIAQLSRRIRQLFLTQFHV